MRGLVNVAILGAGNPKISPWLLASLASYFGERTLHIRLYDADEERLDLFDRYARLCFIITKTTHDLIATTKMAEALADAHRIVVAIDDNCARKYLKAERKRGVADLDDASMIQQALESMLGDIHGDVEVCSLLDRSIIVPVAATRNVEWPYESTDLLAQATPLQVLRWINGEEYVHNILRETADSPLKRWLDDPTTAALS